jgi:hypothetical protein
MVTLLHPGAPGFRVLGERGPGSPLAHARGYKYPVAASVSERIPQAAHGGRGSSRAGRTGGTSLAISCCPGGPRNWRKECPSKSSMFTACLVLLCCGSISAADLASTNAMPPDSVLSTNELAEGLLERANAAVFETLEGGVTWVDGFFAPKEQEKEKERRRVKNSEFSVKLHMRVEAQGGADVSIEPDASADLELPNLSRKVKLVVRSSDIDELPGVDPTEEENSWLVGLARSKTRKRGGEISLGAGAKLNPAPEPYLAINARKPLVERPWHAVPRQRLFWRGDDGFGELTVLNLGRELSTHVGAMSSSAAKWTEESEGVEWDQSLSLAYFPGGHTYRRQRRQHYIGVKGIVFGHKRGSGVVDKYRAQLIWRYPLRKKWLYLDVVPGIDFKNDEDWDETPWIRFGLQVYFDGSAGRREARRMSDATTE